jgi:hypothetical protein
MSPARFQGLKVPEPLASPRGIPANSTQKLSAYMYRTFFSTYREDVELSGLFALGNSKLPVAEEPVKQKTLTIKR